MLSILRALGIGIVAFFAPRLFAAARVATLEQQIAGYKREGKRPRIEDIHRILWIAIYRWFPGHWRGLLRFVSPETVIRWHKRGFRAFWRWRSRPGRPEIDQELIDLIGELSLENPTYVKPLIMWSGQ